jgi:hypothetical protein
MQEITDEMILGVTVRSHFDSHTHKKGVMIISGNVAIKSSDELLDEFKYTIKYEYTCVKRWFRKKKINAKIIDIVVYKELDDYVANRLIEINETR